MLKIYGVPKKSLREYSQDNRKYGFVNFPAEEHRLKEEEINVMEEETQPVDVEAEMNSVFDQSILNPDGA